MKSGAHTVGERSEGRTKIRSTVTGDWQELQIWSQTKGLTAIEIMLHLKNVWNICVAYWAEMYKEGKECTTTCSYMNQTLTTKSQVNCE